MIIIIVAAAFLALFAIVEYFKRRLGLHTEVSRKVVHVLAAAMSAGLPFILTFQEIILLSILFLGVLLLSKKINFFSAIHDVERKTYGEIYFPIAVGLMAYFFQDRVLYAQGLLIMGFSDGFAGLIGQKYGSKKYKILSHRKSYIGSGIFLVSAWAITSLMFLFSGATFSQALLFGGLLGIILTGVEASFTNGLDNLMVPLCASGLLIQCLYFLSLR